MALSSVAAGEAYFASMDCAPRAVREVQLQGSIGSQAAELSDERLFTRLPNGQRCAKRVCRSQPAPDHRVEPEAAPALKFKVKLAGQR
jgi:hypothetical protein